MKSQSLSGKGKKSFRWKYKDGECSSLLGVGHTARQVITDFIKQNSGKDIEYFQKELESIKEGKQHLRVVSLKEGRKNYKDKKRKYYFLEHSVLLNNGEVIVISRRWGATRAFEEKWEGFKNKMYQLGYSIKLYKKSDK